MKILQCDLSLGNFSEKTLEDNKAGGRFLTSKLVSELVPPTTDPLGEKNILVLAAGPFAGRKVTTGGRLSIGAKSPLTGGIKESNAGGMAGDSLELLGYRAVVFSGIQPEGVLSIVIIDEKGPRILDAAPYRGLWNSALVEVLYKDFGKEYICLCNGPAGERLYKASGIAVTDINDKPYRLAARGGLGAVMGSKGIKAILIRKPSGPHTLTKDKNARAAVGEFNKFIANNERVKTLREYGTASTIMMGQVRGFLPVRNFSQGTMERVEEISAETIHDLTIKRGGVGKTAEPCMSGCVIQCSSIFPDENGGFAVAPFEFETLGLCGCNLDINKLDDIARLNYLCNELGLDTIEIGASLGVVMEASETGTIPSPYNLMKLPCFGDGKGAIDMLTAAAVGEEFGELIVNGVVAAGKALGVNRVPAVKGQAMSAYDPRVIKGTGVSYATCPMGADHTAGLTAFMPIDHLDPEKAVAASRASQIQRAAYDALGLCLFAMTATGQRPDLVINMIRSFYLEEIPDDWLDQIGMETIQMEIKFNRAAGFSSADDRLPVYFSREYIEPSKAVFDVKPEDLDSIWT